jgi:hypothetical protein
VAAARDEPVEDIGAVTLANARVAFGLVQP